MEEERYDDLIKLDHEEIENVLTKWNLAKAYQALDEGEKAFIYYEDLAKDLADNPEFLQDYAYILREFGYRDRAQAAAEKYLQLVPDDLNMAGFLNEN